MVGRSGRAAPMAPDARRRAIIEAVTPLLAEHGAAVTTRQLAEAAAVAEGTIFKVFPDKRALITEAVKVSVDPEPFRLAMAAIDPDADFETRLRTGAGILKARLERIIALMAVQRTLPHDPDMPPGLPAFIAEANAAVNETITGLLEPHTEMLRMDLGRAVVIFWGLVFASCLPMVPEEGRPRLDEVIDVMLNGAVGDVEAGC